MGEGLNSWSHFLSVSLTNFSLAFFLSSGFLGEGEKEEEGKAAREKSGRDGGLKVRLALPPSSGGSGSGGGGGHHSVICLSSLAPTKLHLHPYGIWAGERRMGGGGGNLARALSTATYYYYCIAQRGGEETNLCKHRTLFTWPHIPPPF